MRYRQYFWSLLLLLVLCAPLLLTACKSSPDESEELSSVTFSITNYRQISFDDLTSSGTTRATISMTLANLSLSVFNAETGELVAPTILHKSTDYESDGESAMMFSQFSVSLPQGRYKVLVLGYNGSRACNISSLHHIAWEDDYVPNTFLYLGDFTVDGNGNAGKEITLRHVVAAFRVTAEDAIPNDLGKMRFTTTAGGTVLDATTGFTPQNTGRTSDINVPASYAGQENVDFTVYLFLPQEQATGTYTVQAIGKNGAVLNERRFDNVPLRINYMTQWLGKAFEPSGNNTPEEQNGFNIKWDMEWEGTIEVKNEE